MRFQVPQFIEIEDKIIGPLTLKQGMYLGGGIFGTYLLMRLLGIYLGFLFAIPVIIIALALAFYKINNKPFIVILEAAFKFYVEDKLYIWKKEDRKVIRSTDSSTVPTSPIYVPKLSDSKLKDLAWSLDIHEPRSR
jgi:hypothetical protein